MHVIEKKTGTYADTLEGIGLASLLEEAQFGSVTIRDDGARFSLETSSSETFSSGGPPEESAFWPGYPYIWVRKNEPEPSDVPQVLDYEVQIQKRDAYRVWEKSQRPSVVT